MGIVEREGVYGKKKVRISHALCLDLRVWVKELAKKESKDFVLIFCRFVGCCEGAYE
jgi:hypothetical protein